MVDSIATSQTLHLDDEYTGPYAVLNLLKQVLNDGTGSNGLAGDNFPVNLRDVVMPLFGNFEQEFFVTGQSFALATGFGFQVGTGFTQVQAVLLRLHVDHLQRKRPSRGGAEVQVYHVPDFLTGRSLRLS